MPPLRDLLAEETADNATAANAAAMGRSMTGFSGRHTEIPRDAMFGNVADAAPPIAGERITPEDAALPDFAMDPLLMANRGEMSDRERQPFGAQEQVLAAPVRPGYRRYWFSDIPGRIDRAKRAGYAHVIEPATGTPWCRVTDRADGRGRSSYLMETPLRWYQADMAKNAAELDRTLRDIREGRAGPGSGDNRYIPQQGIRITRG